MKKRNLLVMIAMMVSICLSACGNKELPTAEEQIEQAKDAIETLSDKAEDRDAKRAKLIEKNRVDLKEEFVFSGSEVSVKIKAYSIINWDSWGEEEEQIYLIFDHTNNGERDAGFSNQAKFDIYQDGISLVNAGFLDDNWMTAIRTGATIERIEAFTLRNNKSDVVIKITEISTNESAEYTIKIK